MRPHSNPTESRREVEAALPASRREVEAALPASRREVEAAVVAEAVGVAAAAAAVAGEVITEQQPREAEQGRSGDSGRPLISYSSEHYRFCSSDARQIGQIAPHGSLSLRACLRAQLAVTSSVKAKTFSLRPYRISRSASR
jgi:hypothetical protein